MDNTKLAHLVASIGSLNGYGSSIAQTKKALDTGNVQYLKQGTEDSNIFKDVVAGIDAIKEIGFNEDGIIAVNKAFINSEEEDPILPGHLRNTLYNTDDNIAITVDEHSQKAYIPKGIVTREDLKKIVDNFKNSKQTRFDGLRVFAQLSKLQPFQDGNKRTALIAANAALDVWSNEHYLVLPFNDLDKAEFSINLMRYYDANTPDKENEYLKRMNSFLPGLNELNYNKSIEKTKLLENIKTKPLFRDKKVKKQNADYSDLDNSLFNHSRGIHH